MHEGIQCISEDERTGMVLQNIVFPPDEFCEKEIYIRSANAPYRSAAPGSIQQNEVISTDTYMNVFDIDAWKRYTNINNLALVWRFRGKGILRVCWEKENEEAVCLKEAAVENGGSDCAEMRYCFPDFQRMEEGILYFGYTAEKDSYLEAWFEAESSGETEIRLSVVICTYKRKKQLEQLLNVIQSGVKNVSGQRACRRESGRAADAGYNSDWIRTVVVDNASELPDQYGEGITVYHNPNTGGSGGFSRGMRETVRNLPDFQATHVVLMDDDVILSMESIYRLYALLACLKPEYRREAVAGRMFRTDRPGVQYTAAEIWNRGDIRHIGWNQDMTDRQYLWNMNDNTGAEYGGWWFACYPIAFVKENEPLPFFLHCDDVEYGLRHGGTPIILNGIHVWHETYEYRKSAVLEYYDCRNTRILNSVYGWEKEPLREYRDWKYEISMAHTERNLQLEYVRIRAFGDYLKGHKWLVRQNGSKLHKRISEAGAGRTRNALLWRRVSVRFWIRKNPFLWALGKIERGRKVLAAVRKQVHGNARIYISQHPAIGDAYVTALYILEEVKAASYVITAISQGAEDVYKGMGLDSVVRLSREETDCLIEYCHFMNFDQKEIRVLHHQAMQWRTGIAWKLQGVNGINFHDLMHRMVFPQIPRQDWRELTGGETAGFSELAKASSVILFPYANTLYAPPKAFWNHLTDMLSEYGYQVYTYTYKGERPLRHTKSFSCALNRLVSAVVWAGAFIGTRNGLMDVVCGAACKKVIFYPATGGETWIHGRIIDYWSVKAFGYADDVLELEWDTGEREDGWSDNISREISAVFSGENHLGQIAE